MKTFLRLCWWYRACSGDLVQPSVAAARGASGGGTSPHTREHRERERDERDERIFLKIKIM